jgi:hypothetical protein
MAIFTGVGAVVSMLMVALPTVPHDVGMLLVSKCYRLILVLYGIEGYDIRYLYRAAGVEGDGEEQGKSNSEKQD